MCCDNLYLPTWKREGGNSPALICKLNMRQRVSRTEGRDGEERGEAWRGEWESVMCYIHTIAHRSRVYTVWSSSGNSQHGCYQTLKALSLTEMCANVAFGSPEMTKYSPVSAAQMLQFPVFRCHISFQIEHFSFLDKTRGEDREAVSVSFIGIVCVRAYQFLLLILAWFSDSCALQNCKLMHRHR